MRAVARMRKRGAVEDGDDRERIEGGCLQQQRNSQGQRKKLSLTAYQGGF